MAFYQVYLEILLHVSEIGKHEKENIFTIYLFATNTRINIYFLQNTIGPMNDVREEMVAVRALFS